MSPGTEPQRAILRARCSSYRLRLILKDLPGLLFVAQLLDTFSLQVALLGLLKQGIGSPVADQELRGRALAHNWQKCKQAWSHCVEFCIEVNLCCHWLMHLHFISRLDLGEDLWSSCKVCFV